MPPELQGKAIVDGPLPFLFGADAQKLKQRYYLRIITPRTRKAKSGWTPIRDSSGMRGNFQHAH